MHCLHFDTKFVLALIFVFLPIILGWIHTAFRNMDHYRKIELFLVYYLVIGVGFQGVVSGYLHIFHPTFVAEAFGWQQSPFIQQVGMASLSFAFLGISSIWMTGNWRSATGIGFGIFSWLAVFGHLASDKCFDAIMYSDALIPLSIFILLALRRRQKS